MRKKKNKRIRPDLKLVFRPGHVISPSRQAQAKFNVMTCSPPRFKLNCLFSFCIYACIYTLCVVPPKKERNVEQDWGFKDVVEHHLCSIWSHKQPPDWGIFLTRNPALWHWLFFGPNSIKSRVFFSPSIFPLYKPTYINISRNKTENTINSEIKKWLFF